VGPLKRPDENQSLANTPAVHRLLDRGPDKDAHNFVQQVSVELSTDPADVLFDVRSYAERNTKAQGACIDKHTKAKSWQKLAEEILRHRRTSFMAISSTNEFIQEKQGDLCSPASEISRS